MSIALVGILSLNKLLNELDNLYKDLKYILLISY